MMIKYLRIQNFKGWKDTNTIRMAPITLFFGANSSGKSSIGHFLMMLKQTVISQDRFAVFDTGSSETPVNLGSYREMVYGRKSENSIKFQYSWSLPDPLTIENPLNSGQIFSGDEISFSCCVSSDGFGQPIVDDFSYSLLQDSGKTLDVSLKRDNANYDITSEAYSFTRQPGRAWPLRSTIRFYGFPDEAVAYYKNANFVQRMSFIQERLFRSISYLGPLRSKAERLHNWTGKTPESVGYAGENTVSAMLAAQDRMMNFGKRQQKRTLVKTLGYELRNMNLIDDFKVEQIAKGISQYQLKVKTKGSNEFVDLPDVGVGVSQVLPVLTQCYYAEPNSIIIMEQPEIHLHPSAQAALADAFIHVIKSQAGGKSRNIQLIIETHSEHFLRRLQRRIAENDLEDNQLAAYFASVNNGQSSLQELRIDDYGNIKNWPENFFGDEMGDIAGHAKAALAKRRQKAERKISIMEKI